MLKHFLFLIIYLLVLAGCSTYNRIHTNQENGLKVMYLFQLPSVHSHQENQPLAGNSPRKVNLDYLYAQRDKTPPIITMGCKAEQSGDELPDSIFTVILEGEDVRLSVLEGRYIIPENLWVPMFHAQDIRYKLAQGAQEVVIKLNPKEREKLHVFFKKAINLRDQVFPAIPEGQKKW